MKQGGERCGGRACRIAQRQMGERGIRRDLEVVTERPSPRAPGNSDRRILVDKSSVRRGDQRR